MRTLFHTALLSTCMILAGATGRAEAPAAVRLANGALFQGEAEEPTPEGLKVRTPTGTRVIPWKTLSPGTRYRYEPLYRANFMAVVSGLPRSMWTNRPSAPVSKPGGRRPSKTKGESKPSSESSDAGTSASKGSLRLADNLRYENIPPILSDTIPDLQLHRPVHTLSMAIQYGPCTNDVACFVFDLTSADAAPDEMYAYAPGLADYRTPRRIKALKQKKGYTYTARFKKIALQSRFGRIAAYYELRFFGISGRTPPLQMRINVKLRAGSLLSRFTLGGKPSVVVKGRGTIQPTAILDLPILWMRLDTSHDQVRLVGNLKMSGLKLCPRMGMSRDVKFSIVEKATGKKIKSDTIRLDEDMFEHEYGLVYDLRNVQLESGHKYTVSAAIDLGPILGEVSFKQTFTVPARS